MTTYPDDIMEAAREAHARFADSRVTENLGDIIAAALLAERKAKVKVMPLVWERYLDSWISGFYRIDDQGLNWKSDRYWLIFNGYIAGKFGSHEEAEAAAQAHHQGCILSAIIADQGAAAEWPPSPDVVCREKTAALDERLDRLAEFATDLGFQGHAETVTMTRQRVRDLTESYLAACAENDSLRARLGEP